MNVPFPTAPDKPGQPSAYRPAAFLKALRVASRFAGALDAARIACTAGPTVTTDAPYRTTPEEIRIHRAGGAHALEMEAAALFAVGQVRGLPVASAVVIDGVPDDAGTAFRIDNRRAAEVPRDLFAATIGWLAG